MKEKEVLEKFRVLLGQKRNEYNKLINEYGQGEYYDYCRGKRDLIDDIIAYLADELNK